MSVSQREIRHTLSVHKLSNFAFLAACIFSENFNKKTAAGNSNCGSFFHATSASSYVLSICLYRRNTQYLPRIDYIRVLQHWLVGLEDDHVLVVRSVVLLRNLRQ